MKRDQLIRYAQYLFDSMPGNLQPYYERHHWLDNHLFFSCEQGYELVVTITEDDTHETVSKKLFEEFDKQEEHVFHFIF